MTITFNWTDARHFNLVGPEGEDLKLAGVVNEGNLVHVDTTLLEADKDGIVADIYGNRWELSPRGRALAGWDW